jgi:citrate lyase beta subunit
MTLGDEQLAPVYKALKQGNDEFARRFPGVAVARQPVHTVYGGAHLYKPGAAAKLAKLARDHLQLYAPGPGDLAMALGFRGYESAQAILDDGDAAIASAVFDRVVRKLETEAVEDHRVDFEDGYGSRADDEEDAHALAAAQAMAEGLAAGTLPAQVGIRIKALTEEAKVRAIRTLDLFLTALLGKGMGLPARFVVTLPKVTGEQQVASLADCLDLLEDRFGLANGSIRIELMIETIQSILNADGRAGIPGLVAAGRGRVSQAILGTYDYTASCNIAATWQDHRHPAADFARQMMQVSLTGTEVSLCDGITNVMPIAPHRASAERPLSVAEVEENNRVVHAAWKIHFDNIMHSLKLGFYQGWDLNPAQIPVRFAAVYYFFLTGLEAATERLKTFIERAAQASMVGNTFDDAATGQGLVNFFVSGLNCGALTHEEVTAAGITLAELESRSFLTIVENRAQGRRS